MNNFIDYMEAIMSYISSAFSFIRPLFPAAFLGSVLHIRFTKDRRRRSAWYWVKYIIWSTIAGAGIMPTVMYYFDLPLQIANSLTFFVTLCGIEALDSIVYRTKEKAVGQIVDKIDRYDKN